MAIGFTQKHVEEIRFNDLTTEEFLLIAVEASKKLGWVFGDINKNGFVAYTNNGIFSWNAEVKLNIYPGSAKILSQSRNNETIEYGKNKLNLQTFILTFNDLKKSSDIFGDANAYKNLQANFA